MASKRLSKLGVQFHFICRHTALTSIQSSNYLPNSKPCCGRSLHIPSRTPLSPSTACARPSPLVSAKSLGLSVQHSSPTQDMVNLIGKRSNCESCHRRNCHALVVSNRLFSSNRIAA